jgi:hypothetical protein
VVAICRSPILSATKCNPGNEAARTEPRPGAVKCCDRRSSGSRPIAATNQKLTRPERQILPLAVSSCRVVSQLTGEGLEPSTNGLTCRSETIAPLSDDGRRNSSGSACNRTKPYPSRISPPSTQEHPALSSRTEANDRGPERPSTATQNATNLVPEDSDLAAVVDAWDRLPEAIKAGILAMVRASARPTPKTP